jgi:hypothetical protein
MYYVDAPIARPVARFNKLGYRTMFSCAGHMDFEHDPQGVLHTTVGNCYLLFAEDQPKHIHTLYNTAKAILDDNKLVPGAKDIFTVQLSRFIYETGERVNIEREALYAWKYVQICYEIADEPFNALQKMVDDHSLCLCSTNTGTVKVLRLHDTNKEEMKCTK